MAKRNTTMRLDTELFSIASRLAEVDRRSLTAVVELAIIAYTKQPEIQAKLEAAAA